MSGFHVPKFSLAFAKIVATPTPVSWSQVYNAGSLFYALSLTITNPDRQDLLLPAIGKKLFNDFESEFFPLEKKSLKTIKNAIGKSLEDLDPDISTDACLAYFKENILYLFIAGKGKIIMKRNSSLGTILSKKDNDTQIKTASGYLHPADIILLQTDHFTQNVPDQNIIEAFNLELPNDIAETLSPHVHEKEDGGQAAIIITYNGSVRTQKTEDVSLIPETKDENLEEEEEEEEEFDESNSPETPRSPSAFTNKIRHFFLSIPGISRHSGSEGGLPPKTKPSIRRFTRVQIISVILGIIILILLISGIIFTKMKEENANYEKLFGQIYPQAQKNYDEAKALSKLNQNLARDDYHKAEQILKDNMGKFKNGSKEQIQLQSLLSLVQSELNTPAVAPVNKITPIAAEVDDNDMLNIEKNNHSASYGQDDASVYMLGSEDVTTIDKNTGKKQISLKNEQDWTAPIAISPYQGNIYILDKKSGVLKFVAGQNGFGKTDYFKDTPPDIAASQSMAIDGSVWILTRTGKILKYTRGVPDDFSITGLDQPMSSPTKIFTDINTDNIYVLDKGNSRIIKFSKSGIYQNQYSADIIGQAADFEILEKDQKALILSSGKIYSLPL